MVAKMQTISTRETADTDEIDRYVHEAEGKKLKKHAHSCSTYDDESSLESVGCITGLGSEAVDTAASTAMTTDTSKSFFTKSLATNTDLDTTIEGREDVEESWTRGVLEYFNCQSTYESVNNSVNNLRANEISISDVNNSVNNLCANEIFSGEITLPTPLTAMCPRDPAPPTNTTSKDVDDLVLREGDTKDSQYVNGASYQTDVTDDDVTMESHDEKSTQTDVDHSDDVDPTTNNNSKEGDVVDPEEETQPGNSNVSSKPTTSAPKSILRSNSTSSKASTNVPKNGDNDETNNTADATTTGDEAATREVTASSDTTQKKKKKKGTKKFGINRMIIGGMKKPFKFVARCVNKVPIRPKRTLQLTSRAAKK